MAQEPTQTPVSEPIEPMHWLVGVRPDKAVCGADRRRTRTTRQYDLVTCPECRPELVGEVVAHHAALAAGG